MSDIVIKAENLGKKYTIGHQAENGSYLALRDVLMHNARGLWHKTRDLARGKPIITGDSLEEIWALKDVSFEIRRGEAVGIIGRNGAGKSTLLKVLSRITEPSAGRVTIKGRVASLLEVGTGFHPELTGRENIYLNGAILGMTRAEIKRKFDEIVDFAEIEKFLDTPVKRYSSGMYVRLAFAVAAHLEPEILVVDEVLAVGDVAFQQKCLGKMSDVAKEGRTVLFVSHNMAAIQSLTSRTMLLHSGSIAFCGTTNEAIQEYAAATRAYAAVPLSQRTDRTGIMPGVIREINLFVDSRAVSDTVVTGLPLDIQIKYCAGVHSKLDFYLAFYDMFERRIVHLNSIMSSKTNGSIPSQGTIVCKIPKLSLTPGRYSLAVAIDSQGETLDRVENAHQLMVTMGDFYGTGRTRGSDWGMVLVEHQWDVLVDNVVETSNCSIVGG